MQHHLAGADVGRGGGCDDTTANDTASDNLPPVHQTNQFRVWLIASRGLFAGCFGRACFSRLTTRHSEDRLEKPEQCTHYWPLRRIQRPSYMLQCL